MPASTLFASKLLILLTLKLRVEIWSDWAVKCWYVWDWKAWIKYTNIPCFKSRKFQNWPRDFHPFRKVIVWAQYSLCLSNRCQSYFTLDGPWVQAWCTIELCLFHMSGNIFVSKEYQLFCCSNTHVCIRKRTFHGIGHADQKENMHAASERESISYEIWLLIIVFQFLAPKLPLQHTGHSGL